MEDHYLGGIAGRRSINSRSRMAVMMDKILKKKIKVKFLIASLYTFPRHDYQSGLAFPPPGDLPDPGIKPESPTCLGRLILHHGAT